MDPTRQWTSSVSGPTIWVFPDVGGTVYQAPAFTSTNVGNEGYSFRLTRYSERLPGCRTIRVTFKGPTTATTCQVAQAAVGVFSHVNMADTVNVPNELLFSGASGFTLGQNALLVSDWTTVTGGFGTSDGIVIIMDIAGVNGDLGAITPDTEPNIHTCYKAATASFNSTSSAGFTDGLLSDFVVWKIEGA